MDIPQKILDEIWEYCRLNKITDVDGFILKMLKQGFTVEKFGATPTERIVEKEVEKIVEVIKEIEVEKIVEVIKEIEVVKEVQITDDSEIQILVDKTNKLSDEMTELKRNAVLCSKSVDLKTKEIKSLKNKVKSIEAELKAERLKTKDNSKRDIYGENKKGFDGSI